MSFDPETTRILRSWLDEGVTQLPERVLDSVLDDVHATPQRRATWWPVWRYPAMSKFVGLGLAAAAVVVAAVVGLSLITTSPNLGPPGSTAVASPTAVSMPTPYEDAPVPTWPAVVAGPLDAGTYQTIELEGTDVVVQFTVPDGWSWNGFYLSKGAPNAQGVVVSFWTGDLQVYSDPCQWAESEPVPPTGPTASDLIAGLTAQPTRQASEPETRSASSFSQADIWPGMAVSLTVPDDISFSDCDAGQFRSWGPEPNERYHQGRGQTDYVWALDVAGFRVVVDSAWMPDMPESLRAEARAIMDSIMMWDTH